MCQKESLFCGLSSKLLEFAILQLLCELAFWSSLSLVLKVEETSAVRKLIGSTEFSETIWITDSATLPQWIKMIWKGFVSSIKIRQESVRREKFYPFCPSKLIVEVFSLLSVEFAKLSPLFLNNVCKFLKTCKLGGSFFFFLKKKKT